ncbi:putative ubiquitin c-terminal hydrolase family protein [Phaeomoniella chlamydospora]|uniref:ubiquitinyl hydrolase 1 n=1 Tax=Phaeomoniella chlamydospora TaxID=158046 RepID=A0A0G2F392_PHACM|nr:putative ubiquitin c-terminal hydrolase family protein [Phaeomoniella chlamydospora]
MLRSGELITTDITEMVQKALSDCGWPDAYELHQQDASEAFTFITSQLELPLLTLKMDIYHTGKEDAADDHKFINERLLEVAIPSPAPEEPQTVTLEDCLEAYFNNRIEVRRYLERRERSNTTSSAKSFDSFSKAGAVHVETLEVESPESPGSTPATPTASMPARLRHRAPSIVQQRFIPDKDAPSGDRASVVSAADPAGQLRKGSIRKEIMMPAWQIFSLIPWYTDNTPTSDTQVAAHFSSQRPVLGMCLKRYSMTPSGQATRLGTYVDIPVEIGLPYFIKDDNMDEDASLYGNFKLSLQSVVCHRGNSVDSGHYISLVRGTTASTSTLDVVAEAPKQWMRFDDLASERITIIDIEQALKEETPYLLFYQILPIDGDPDHITEGEQPSVVNSDMGDSGGDMGSSTVLKENVVKDLSASELTIDSERLSVDDQRGRSPERDSNRRSSLSFSEPEVAVQDQATFSQLTSRRGSKCENIKSGKFSRSQSQTSEKLTAALSRLTQRKSKEKVSFDGVPSATASHSSTAVTPLMSITNGSTDPEVSLIEVTDFSAAPATKTSLDNVNAHSHRQRQNKGKAPARTLSKREKSKSRLRDRLHSGSASDEEKLDRECIVM